MLCKPQIFRLDRDFAQMVSFIIPKQGTHKGANRDKAFRTCFINIRKEDWIRMAISDKFYDWKLVKQL